MADFSNQLDLFNPRYHSAPVHLIGLGGIGSSLLLPLIKLGLTDITLYDDDVLEESNIPSQLIYCPGDIGKPKVEAAAAFAERYGVQAKTVNARVDADTPFEGIVISGVDSMTSRYAIWEAVGYNPEVLMYMDGRIGGEQLTYFTAIPADPDSMDRYEATLFPEEESAGLPCGARAIIHPAVMLAGVMVYELARFLREEAEPLPELAYDMPTYAMIVNTPTPTKEYA